MAWTAPRTWTTAELVTAAMFNEQIRDNELYLKGLLHEAGYVHIRDEKPNNTNGGTFTSGAWQTRDLNVELSDTGGDAALASNQITLEPGTYRCLISCPALTVYRHKARLQNITDGITILVGTSETAAVGSAVQNKSFIVGRFTLAAQKVLEVQHRCNITSEGSGFGMKCGAGYEVVEVYTEVELWKEE